MSLKDKEIHDTLIMAKLLPETISMEECMKLLRTLKAEMEIQHHKELQGMFSIEEAKEVLRNGTEAGFDFVDKFGYIAAYINSRVAPGDFVGWDNRALSAIEKKKKDSKEPEPCREYKYHKSGKCLRCGKTFEDHNSKFS